MCFLKPKAIAGRLIVAARWGRTQESVSECPWLNGAYASAFVRGFQGAGDGIDTVKAAACCKHFYACTAGSPLPPCSPTCPPAPPPAYPPPCLGGLDESVLWMLVDSLEGSDGFSRHNFNAVVSQRDLHETFLPAFQTCVAAAPEQIMCRYVISPTLSTK
jgi:hypothetical protein|eukprot:COSAG02_NODE_2295_length_9197_cov_20.855463_12_plen_160_part_00